MFPIALIVFREFLEMALIVGIAAAATRGMRGRGRLIGGGVAAGMLGATLIALFTETISGAAEGRGQDLLNAGIMFAAAGFIGHTLIWMRRNGRDMSARLKQAGAEATDAPRTLVAVVASAVFREGAEVVLFGYGMAASGRAGVLDLLGGLAAGAAAGAAVGGLFYIGLLRASQKHIFTVSSLLLMFLCAGMAAQGADFLTAADILPPLIPQVWDSSAWVEGRSTAGRVLGVLIGYTPRPTGLQLLMYVLTLGILHRLCTADRRRPV